MRLLLNPQLLKISKIFSRGAHLRSSPNAHLSKSLWNRYRKLPNENCKSQVTYIWIDGNESLRAKTRTMDYLPTSQKDCPTWHCNGSVSHFTGVQAADVLLCPVALYNDPTHLQRGKLVLCETYTDDGKPTKTNHRHRCMESLNKTCDKEPMFGFEQHFTFMDVNDRPLGWPGPLGEPSPQTSHYSSLGAHKVFGRELVECVYRGALYSGVDIAGSHPEATPSQWEIQTGPTVGMKAADDLWMLRYLLLRIAEDFGVSVTFRQEVSPNWPKSGGYANFSTKDMRDEGGLSKIEDALKKLEASHDEQMKVYHPEGCDKKPGFKGGVNDRSASVRISGKVAREKKGYLQDRRVPANADPYQVVNALCTFCINK